MRFWFILFCFVHRCLWRWLKEPPVAKASTASFNPDISLILSGGYAQLSNDPDRYALPGFMLGAETGPGTRGLSLAESELVMSANVDDLFYGYFMASIAPDNSISVEEAAVETRGLAAGITLRVGRFYSVLATSIPASTRLGLCGRAARLSRVSCQPFADDGVQLRWVAPADVFVEFGAEWFRGQNYPAGGAANNGQGAASAFVMPA